MEAVILTAVGVGGATLVGALIGLFFKNPSHKTNDIILSFAAGVMLAAAVIGLILPSVELGEGNWYSLLVTVAGVFAGAICLNLMDKLVPHLHKLTGVEGELHPENSAKLDKVLLFVMAIAIHNLPEGIAAGVSCSGDASQSIIVAAGIALQNIPEGMVIIAPMIAGGMSKGRTFLIAAATGMVEVIGTFIGFFAGSISAAVLPFVFAFAGGTMLYVISDEMIPETHAHGNERASTYSLLAGFCVMLVFDVLLG